MSSTAPAPDDDRDDLAPAPEVVELDRVRERRDAAPAAEHDDQDAEPGSEPVPDDADDDDEGGSGAGVLLVNSAPEPSALRGSAAVADERRAPVVPGWVRDRGELEQRARWAVGFYGHICAFHAVRVPLYGARLGLRAPAGAASAVGHTARWLRDAEGHPARQAALVAADTKEYLRLSAQRDSRVQSRWLIALFAAPAALWLFAAAVAPGARWALLLATVGLLGKVGSPADRPLVGRAVVSTAAPQLTDDIVVRALGALSIAEINKALAKGADKDWFPAPITRDGPGWRAEVDLPYGVTVTDIIEKRDKLASGLRRPLSCVWPEPEAEEHPGRLVLWVADRPMSKTKQPAWPLAKTGTADLFHPVPLGTDQRGRPVTLTLMFASMVVGAIPRMGKTFTVRLILLAAALDVRAAIYAFDLKGMGDLSALEPIAHRYRAGDDDDDVAYLLAAMRELQAELRRRTKVIRGLPRDVAPESKLTPELASNRSLGLHPIVVNLDECQRAFEHPTYGAEIAEIGEDLTRRGPAAGIIAIFATQRPDAKSLPTGISGNAVLRFCLKVMDQVANDQVLGTSSYKAGIRATLLSRSDLGVGILSGEGDEPQITRTYFVDNPGAERIVTRARALREAAGTLSGHALGQEPDLDQTGPQSRLLDDVLAVIGADEDRIWSETVVARLAELRPEVYAGWAPEQLGAVLKPLGVDTDQIGRRIDGKTVNRRGIDRADVAAAITARDRTRGPS